MPNHTHFEMVGCTFFIVSFVLTLITWIFWDVFYRKEKANSDLEKAKRAGPFLCPGRLVSAIKKPTVDHAYGPGASVVAGEGGPTLFTTHFVIDVEERDLWDTVKHKLSPIFPGGIPLSVMEAMKQSSIIMKIQVPVDHDEFSNALAGRSGHFHLRRTQVSVLMNPFDKDHNPTFSWIE